MSFCLITSYDIVFQLDDHKLLIITKQILKEFGDIMRRFLHVYVMNDPIISSNVVIFCRLSSSSYGKYNKNKWKN
jgi:hypothetical protein